MIYELARPSRSINGRDYLRPVRPTVVICFDGCDPTFTNPNNVSIVCGVEA